VRLRENCNSSAVFLILATTIFHYHPHLSLSSVPASSVGEAKMLPKVWKSELRNGPDQNYTAVHEEDDKFAEDSLLPSENIDRQVQVIQKLRLLLNITVSLLVVLLAVILILLLSWSSKSPSQPLLKTPVPQCKQVPQFSRAVS